MLSCLSGRHLVAAKAFHSFINLSYLYRFVPGQRLLITVCLLDHPIIAGSISVYVNACPHSGRLTDPAWHMGRRTSHSCGMLQERLNNVQRCTEGHEGRRGKSPEGGCATVVVASVPCRNASG